MRILYLADIRFPLERANGIQTMETCYALAERDHAVRLLVRPSPVQPPRDPFEFYGLPPHPHLSVQHVRLAGSEPIRRLEYVLQAIAAAGGANGGHDVVMTRDLTVASLILRLPRALRPPLLFESHGFAPVVAETRSELIHGGKAAPASKISRLDARERRVWTGAEGYVTITDGIAQELAARFGSRERLVTVPDGVRFQPGRRFAPPRLRSSPVITYAGHLYPWKGVDVLLRAFALLPRVSGVVVGGHPAEGDFARLHTLASALGIQDRVRFTGFVHRRAVVEQLEGADVLVIPHTQTPVSERYASPLKLFEYMAMGKPIVASNLSAIREVLRDGENACLVAPGSPEALAAGINKVLDDVPYSERIAHRAFDDAAAYTWARRAERLEALLEVMVKA